MSEPALPDKIVAIDRALAAVPHAFGGALALAYHAEPRATIDIDLNVFVSAGEAERVLAPLRDLGVRTGGAGAEASRSGQARVMWGRTPVDLFFAYDRFHAAVDRGAHEVPFLDGTIRVLSPEHLTVCKVVFDRPRDWVDIDAMRAIGTSIDAAEVLRWVGRIIGDDDPRYDRIASVLMATP
ncbi:nucleotidyl transferase AbiEii/AbiGii toxin family protein [Rhabdothermincola sp.]|uniref:nucleotidyl transferase AbiEii/AbiGii toxin family protein n=1 Tax=Rhabdothermincola sp. TaxID=2820405 RepID=UPI002FE1037A